MKMFLRRLGPLTLAILTLYLVGESKGADLPGISDFFKSIKQKFTSNDDVTLEEIDVDSVKSREKRQDPGIGDESTSSTSAQSST